MSSKTIYRCDSCHKEISIETKNRVTLNGHVLFWNKPYHNFDVCEECMEQILGWFGVKSKLKRKKK
jgi:uncharacterized protein YlaI